MSRLHPVLATAARSLPTADRIHLTIRARSFDLDAVCAEVPRSGRILEIGCGHGLVSSTLALDAPDREVVGYDIDRSKIRSAEILAAAVERAGGRFRLVEASDAKVPPGPWSAVVIADVIYLLPPADQEELLDACVDELGPGGVVVLKEIDDRPRWKAAFARAEEFAATRIVRITDGSALHWRPSADWAALLAVRGLDVAIHRIDRRSPYPHVVITGTRPVSGREPEAP